MKINVPEFTSGSGNNSNNNSNNNNDNSTMFPNNGGFASQIHSAVNDGISEDYDNLGPPARKKYAVDNTSAGGNAGRMTEITDGVQRLAQELADCTKDAILAGAARLPLEESAVADLQLITCRKLRELLPVNKDLLLVAQQRNWIPLLLTWLNLHDRPAVQVESLLALTNIAELCAQQTYFGTNPSPSAVVTAAAAAQAAVKAGNAADVMELANKYSKSLGYPPVAPGSVPFPPLSFSQTLSPEAVAAFDASLTCTLQAAQRNNNKLPNTHGWSMPPAPLFPAPTSFPGGINFTSLAPPPGGAHSSGPHNAFLPPPTPPAGQSSIAFPQPLSASSQHLLLRHADAIPTLISLLGSPNKEVYEQSMWILGSIAAGDSPAGSGNDKTVSARDVILAAGVMNQLLRCLESHTGNMSLQRIGSWTLSNLVDGIFQNASSTHKSGSNSLSALNNSNNINAGPGSNSINNGGIGNNSTKNNSSNSSSEYSSSDEIDMKRLLPVLKRLLRMGDAEVLSYTCWTLSHLCDGPSSHIAAVVTSEQCKGGLVPRLVELLVHPSWRVTKPALRTIGNIVCAECSDDSPSSATTDYTEVILDCGAVPRLKELITHTNREIQKEACWTLSNIAAGTVDQIQAVIDSGAIPPLVKLVRDKKTDQEVRSEACWVVLNATSCGCDSQIEVLVDEGCVAVLGVLLSEATMVMMALEGLERVLQVEETRELIRREQIETGEIEDDEETRLPTLVSAAQIEKARDLHSSSAVTKRADRIWKQHFVSCALCHKSFSKHRISDASFCEECKCHVCSNCNCRIYHLDYQEELWAATEEKTEAKKNAKKSKNKKKKEKLRQKKAKQQNQEPEVYFSKDVKAPSAVMAAKDARSRSSNVSESSDSSDKNDKAESNINDDDNQKEKDTDAAQMSKQTEKAPSPTPTFADDEDDEDDAQNQIDLVLYLQQTGSIIALAKLMDALEMGGDDFDDELDDYERKMIREQQTLRNSQATTTGTTGSAH